MIRLHHLNQSRSLRTLWLLEEIGEPYEVTPYLRDKETNLAPESLKDIHQLGKSPVIELDGQVIAESGAITEILIERFAADRLRPAMDTPEYAEYLQWIHFAESSMILPMLLELFTSKAGVGDNQFLASYINQEKTKVLGYLNDSLEGKSFIVGDTLTGADFMLAFNIIMLDRQNQLEAYPHIKAYAKKLSELDSFQKAMALEAKYAQ